MKIEAVTIRPARAEDADTLADIHDAAWQGTYRGILPGIELERLLSRRGVSWWHAAIRYKTRILVLEVCGTPAGYATFGHSRLKHLPFPGEIYELYLQPDHQGLGFGRQLFLATRGALRSAGMAGFAVRVLKDNLPARSFYEAMGGVLCDENIERIGRSDLSVRIYGWAERSKPG
ncbi:ribosomal protein S18 acetylase RimI-like enzyme [Breoghania corrubedonensis]|uniref:Ribosomal protein S18 acetylase RimI-like enzyme n=1 Tax=Breoghania corrubedonensis TaxID=665038 RepID=A0A2T5V5W2_9HYPH|nr:GNAT family N-acetyltransferase [Breoghania corrubedonensis]PTW59116.1 ribosomal protein S18 acetylase RimI-like enzyme [Breoghania corrubedonensis]